MTKQTYVKFFIGDDADEEIYINPRHVVTVQRAGKESNITTVDGKMIIVYQFADVVVDALEEACRYD